MKKRALITGITGQDGSYLADLLLARDYEVFGFVRRTSNPRYQNIAHILDKVTLIEGDLLDQQSLFSALVTSQPDEVYNLAAQSFVGQSWNHPIADAEMTALGCLRLLEAIRGYNRRIKFYQASSAEMFGNSPAPQNEDTPFVPRSPYGCSKLFAHATVRNYRESFGLFACSGILFNHESPRRGLQFVTRKITDGVAQIVAGKKKTLELGNLDAMRDWGFAGDYVEAMWLMLQQPEAKDYVVGTGELHTVKDFLHEAFAHVGLAWEDYVVQNPAFMRPAEVHQLRADSRQAKKELGWQPTVSFPELVAMMVDADRYEHGVPGRIHPYI